MDFSKHPRPEVRRKGLLGLARLLVTWGYAVAMVFFFMVVRI